MTEITVWLNVRTTTDRLICPNLNYFERGFHAELCNLFCSLYRCTVASAGACRLVCR